MGILHRYNSTIHGNYRKAYLRCGAITGVLLAAYMLVRLLMGNPLASVASYVSDIILAVAIILFTAYYRKALPDGKITLKEAMLFGTGCAVVAAVIYGVAVWLTGTAFPQQVVIFTNTVQETPIDANNPQLHYLAIWWAMLAAVEVAVLGAFFAFIAAIILRTEKAPARTKANNKK